MRRNGLQNNTTRSPGRRTIQHTSIYGTPSSGCSKARLTTTTTNGPEIDDVTVGYGEDDAMFDSWGDDVEWWETVAPQDGCTRFRIFYPNEHKVVPRGSST